MFCCPYGLALVGDKLFVSTNGLPAIRQIDMTTSIVSTLCGTGAPGPTSFDLNCSSVRFGALHGLVYSTVQSQFYFVEVGRIGILSTATIPPTLRMISVTPPLSQLVLHPTNAGILVAYG